MPAVADSKRPVVILRLRGYTRAGSTLIDVLDEYADELAEAGGRLYLSGVDDKVGDQLRRTGKVDLGETVHPVSANEVLGVSTEEAAASGRQWLGSARRSSTSPDGREEKA